MARPTVWEDTLVNEDITSGGSALVGLTLQLDDTSKRGSTITRMLIRLNFHEEVLNSGTALQRVDLGIGIASQEAFALGVTALPAPQTATERPRLGWYFREEVMVRSSTTDTGFGVPVLRVQADIRAMRKLENGELYLRMNSVGSVGVDFTVRAVGLIRTLVRLP